ncbi:putative quinol monooxygenase [Aerosakkonemataceae cyanobacterium BLCC-F154]|uniref:Quinol monooxygenase n=1 Tax=Floridaenema fluviatile BLCC-F154 TaxID=3153640 RepID=A0ABV4YE82_9CYAN
MLKVNLIKWLKKPVLLLLVVTLTLGIAILPQANATNTKQINQPVVEQRTKQNPTDTDFAGLPLVLAARFKIKPAQRATFLQLANVALKETVKETGVITYNLYEDTDTKNSFIFFEEWKSRQALDSHLQRNYTKNLLDKFPQLVDGEPSIKVYKVQGVDFILGM